MHPEWNSILNKNNANGMNMLFTNNVSISLIVFLIYILLADSLYVTEFYSKLFTRVWEAVPYIICSTCYCFLSPFVEDLNSYCLLKANCSIFSVYFGVRCALCRHSISSGSKHDSAVLTDYHYVPLSLSKKIRWYVGYKW